MVYMTESEKKRNKFLRDLRKDAKNYVAGCKEALQMLKIPEPDHNVHKEFFIGNYVLYDGKKKYTLNGQAKYRFLDPSTPKYIKWRQRLEDMHHADDAGAGFDEYANELQEFVETFTNCFKKVEHSKTIRVMLSSICSYEQFIKHQRSKLKEYLQKHNIDLCCDMPSKSHKMIEKTIDDNKKYISKQIMAFKPKSDL